MRFLVSEFLCMFYGSLLCRYVGEDGFAEVRCGWGWWEGVGLFLLFLLYVLLLLLLL